jgi:hypothetical protein
VIQGFGSPERLDQGEPMITAVIGFSLLSSLSRPTFGYLDTTGFVWLSRLGFLPAALGSRPTTSQACLDGEDDEPGARREVRVIISATLLTIEEHLHGHIWGWNWARDGGRGRVLGRLCFRNPQDTPFGAPESGALV